MSDIQPLSLPENLGKKLRGFAGAYRKHTTIVYVMWATIVMGLSWLALYTLDRFMDTSVSARILLWLCTVVWLCLVSFRAVSKLLPKSDRQLSSIISNKFPRRGDTLRGAIELATGDVMEGMSQSLRHAAVKQASNTLDDVNFIEALDRRATRRAVRYMSFVSVAIIALAWFDMRAVNNALHRWANPFTSTPRYTFVQFNDVEDSRTVIKGEDFEVSVVLAQDSRLTPDDFRYRIEPANDLAASAGGGSVMPWKRVELIDGKATFGVPGQQNEGVLRIRSRDASLSMAIHPVYRPVITDIKATITLPDYLQRDPESKHINGKTLSVLAGAQVAIEGQASRPLMEMDVNGQPGWSPMVDGDLFQTPAVAVDKGFEVSLRWKDILGLGPVRGRPLEVKLHDDQAPRVRLMGVERDITLLADEAVDFRLEASDDFGLRSLEARWEVREEDPHEPGFVFRQQVGLGGPWRDALTGQFAFSPEDLDIPGNSLVLVQGTARDYLPKRKQTMSPVYRIQVLDNAEHAQQLRDRFEMLLEQLESLARREDQSLIANRSMSEMHDSLLAEAETQAAIAHQLQNEQRSDESLQQMLQQGAVLMKDALRNRKFPKEILTAWHDFFEALQDLRSNRLASVLQKLADAHHHVDKRRPRLKEAVAAQSEMLDIIKRLLIDMDRSLDELQALNFANRLRAQAKAEQEVKAKLEEIIPDTIGLRAKELNAKQTTSIALVEHKQKKIRSLVEAIQDDLRGFYERVKEKKYKTVFTKMEEANTIEKLDQLAQVIGRNHAGRGIVEADHWQGKLNEWATLLAPKSKGQKGGKGDKRKDKKFSDEELEIMFRLLRLVQGENMLRTRTRFLERDKGQEQYSKRVEKLAKKQEWLRNELGDVMTKVSNPQALETLRKAHTVMKDAHKLLSEPRTDQKTIAAETEIIEMLAKGMKQAVPNMSKDSSMMKEVSRMVQQQGDEPGKAKNQGGLSEMQAQGSEGKATGTSGGTREAGGTQGIDLNRVPAEFRDAMQTYFQQLERLNAQ